MKEQINIKIKDQINKEFINNNIKIEEELRNPSCKKKNEKDWSVRFLLISFLALGIVVFVAYSMIRVCKVSTSLSPIQTQR